MRRIIFSLVLLFITSIAFGQIYKPVKWNFSSKHLGGDNYELTFTASIKKGWYVYGQDIPDDGPNPTLFYFENLPSGVKKVGKTKESKLNRKTGFDKTFEMNVTKYAKKAIFTQRITATSTAKPITGYLEFMTCNDERCLPPDEVDFSFKLKRPKTASKPIAKTDTKPKTDKKIIRHSTFPKKKEATSGQDKVASNDYDYDENFFKKNSLPVKWKVSAVRINKDEYDIVFNAEMREGYSIYSQFSKNRQGPMPTKFNIEGEGDNFKIIRSKEKGLDRNRGYDSHFNMNLTKFKKQVAFTKRIKREGGSRNLKGRLFYQASNNEEVLTPQPYDFRITLPTKVTPDDAELAKRKREADKAKALAEAEKAEETTAEEDNTTTAIADNIDSKEINMASATSSCSEGEEGDDSEKGLWWIFFAGFGGGLIALLTPCVFPMIPLTVSFFTKQSKTKAKGVTNALIYGASIIAIYVALGTMVTLAFGPEALNLMSTSAFFNLLFFALFAVFAFSFFGYFEITLPSSWSNSSDKMADRGGLLGIFFMAFTLALVSFSCTGPIIGTLLVEAANGGGLTLADLTGVEAFSRITIRPILGMLGFATALAIPFVFFAAFPGWLNSLPRSGGWMTTVKVTLGFLELAFALKFLSVVDLTQNWGILRIEIFLGVWMLLFLGLALYLFGFIKFPHDGPLKNISKARYALGLASLAFVVYLGTGFNYKPLKVLSGIAPSSHYNFFQDKVAEEYPDCPHGIRCFKDYEEGLSYAKEQDLPLLIDFTGHGCVNCRKVEENVWGELEVKPYLQKEYVLVSLYVDDRKPLETPMVSPYTGKKLRSVGKKWQDFQTNVFNTNSQPYYVLMDNDGTVLNKPVGYDLAQYKDKYAEFLQCGLDRLVEKKRLSENK